MTSRRFAFGHFVYDRDLGALFRHGASVDLGSRAMALLQVLLEAEGKGVSKSDLMDTVWPGLNVEESNLTVQIAALRKCLAESSDETWIETVPRMGYRFLRKGTAEADGRQEKASIAVLPFTNMGGDPEQDVFTDGLSEDLITDLSRNVGLFVIARHSTFTYEGRLVDVRSIANDLGVRYILQGSARRSAGRVRINVQLVDAHGGDNLWAERFDRNLEDIFAVQDEVTARIVEALVGRLTTLPVRNRPGNMEAYELCLRARKLTRSMAGSPEVVRECIMLSRQAIALEPSYAEAFRWLAFNLWSLWADAIDPSGADRALSLDMAKRAVALDPNDGDNRWVLGKILAYEQCWAESESEFSAALDLDPNNADAWAMKADLSVFCGEPLAAIEHAQKAFRLNPYPAAWYYWELGFAQYAARQYEAAVMTLREEATYRTVSRRVLAASLAQLGRVEEARREAALFLTSNPTFTIRHWSLMHPFRDEATLAHFVDGYRKAGLPD